MTWINNKAQKNTEDSCAAAFSPESLEGPYSTVFRLANIVSRGYFRLVLAKTYEAIITEYYEEISVKCNFFG